MKEKYEIKKNFFGLLLIALLCAALWVLKVDAVHAVTVYSNAGQWDLRSMNFENDYAVLDGPESEYVLGQMLTPEEFAESDDIEVGSVTAQNTYLTARMRLRVPEGQTYGIYMHSAPYASRIYINGEWVQDIGTPGTSAEEMKAGGTTLYYTVTPQNGVIEIVQQVSNYVHHEFHNPKSLIIGSLKTASRHYARETFVSSLITGTCLILGGVHLLLYYFWRSYRINLLSGLFCLVYVLRLSVTGSKILVMLFPDVPWEIVFRIEYISMPLMGVLIFLIIHTASAAMIQKWALWVFLAAEGVVIICFLFANTFFMSEILYISHGIHLLMALYLLVRCAIKWRSLSSVQFVSKLPIYGIFLYAVIREMLYFESIIIFPFVAYSLMDYALLVFIMTQTMATYMDTLSQIRLAWHNEEIARFEAIQLRKKARKQARFISTIPPNHRVSIGPLVMDTLANRAYIDQNDLLLTPKEFSLLLMLAQHAGELFTRQQIYEQVWKQPASGGTRSVVTIISSLRKKIELANGPFSIEANRGEGYCFEYIEGDLGQVSKPEA